MVIRHVDVSLGAKEYGNDLMARIAAETFAARPDVPGETLIVCVHEHGGWFLSYLRDGTVVGTANDTAVFTGKAREFHDDVKARNEAGETIKHEYEPWIYRP